MNLPAQWQKNALDLIDRARSVDGDFFRSVELSYAFPDDVISGEGSRQYGGRFVKPGVRAVYGSAEAQTAVAEAAYRRSRLAGGSVIVELPRITYVINVKLGAAVDLTASDPDVQALLPACLRPDHFDSQDVGEFLRERGVQGVACPRDFASWYAGRALDAPGSRCHNRSDSRWRFKDSRWVSCWRY